MWAFLGISFSLRFLTPVHLFHDFSQMFSLFTYKMKLHHDPVKLTALQVIWPLAACTMSSVCSYPLAVCNWFKNGSHRVYRSVCCDLSSKNTRVHWREKLGSYTKLKWAWVLSDYFRFIYTYVYVSVWLYVSTCSCLQRSEEGIRFLLELELQIVGNHLI